MAAARVVMEVGTHSVWARDVVAGSRSGMDPVQSVFDEVGIYFTQVPLGSPLQVGPNNVSAYKILRQPESSKLPLSTICGIVPQIFGCRHFLGWPESIRPTLVPF
jgi:hypothetical protein